MAEITKLWIAGQMRELMKHKPIGKIRVTEICKAADIERPTFYYHFGVDVLHGRLRHGHHLRGLCRRGDEQNEAGNPFL